MKITLLGEKILKLVNFVIEVCYFELVILKCYETDVYLSPGQSMVLGVTGLIFC